MRLPIVLAAAGIAFLVPAIATACPRTPVHVQMTVTSPGVAPVIEGTDAPDAPVGAESARGTLPPGTVTLYDLAGLRPDGRIGSSADGSVVIGTHGPDGKACFGRLQPSGDLLAPRLGTEPIDTVVGAVLDNTGDYFLKLSDGDVDVVTKAGRFAEYPVFSIRGDYNPGIALGFDDNVWIAENSANAIGRLKYDGALDEYKLPKTGGHPFDITRGPDNALWFTETSGRIGRIAMDGKITEYAVSPYAGSLEGIALGPDGALWFAAPSANTIGRITTAGVVSTFAVPTPNSRPASVFVGTDGGVWFTESAAGKIARMSTTGDVTEYKLGETPTDLIQGADGGIWFAYASGVGRIEPAK